MAQSTLVLKLGSADQARLREAVRGGDFEFRPVDHAHFSARADGVVATLYRSGKLVVQGAGAEVFVARYLPEEASGGARPAGASASASTTPS